MCVCCLLFVFILFFLLLISCNSFICGTCIYSFDMCVMNIFLKRNSFPFSFWQFFFTLFLLFLISIYLFREYFIKIQNKRWKKEIIKIIVTKGYLLNATSKCLFISNYTLFNRNDLKVFLLLDVVATIQKINKILTFKQLQNSSRTLL